LRDRYAEIQALGAEVVVIGTGDVRYARSFAEDDHIPFPVLVDDDAQAAAAAGVERAGLFQMFAPGSFGPTLRAWRAGFRIGRPGRRVDQMGASFVVSPDPERLIYQHYDQHPADHAPMEAIFDALRRPESRP
jgi:hypothetical protein